MDRGSGQSYVLKDTAEIRIQNSSSIDASNMGISVIRSKNITISNFTLKNAAHENIICHSLGIPLQESESGYHELQNIGGMYSCGISVEMSKNVMFSGTIAENESEEPGTPGSIIRKGVIAAIIGSIVLYFAYRTLKKIKNI